MATWKDIEEIVGAKRPTPEALASRNGSASPRTDKAACERRSQSESRLLEQELAEMTRLNALHYDQRNAALELIETNQNCSPNNHTIAVIAMDAIEAMPNHPTALTSILDLKA